MVTHWIQHKPYPDSNVHGANMGPIRGRQDPGGSHVSPMNFAISVHTTRLDRGAEIRVTVALSTTLEYLMSCHLINTDDALLFIAH